MKTGIDKKDLMEWLAEVDGRLKKETEVIAVGGTAMTLLGLKPSTQDVDFCVDGEERKAFEEALDKRFRVDIFTDGYIFSEQLPEDYKDIASVIKKMKNIILKALAPVDIIITKAARFNARDEQDIQSLVPSVKKEELKTRFEQVVDTYAGNEEEYRYHMDIVFRRFYL